MKSKGGTIVPTSASQPIGLATLLMGVDVGFMQGFAFSTLDLRSVERHSVPLRCKKQHGVLFYTTSTECCSTLPAGVLFYKKQHGVLFYTKISCSFRFTADGFGKDNI